MKCDRIIALAFAAILAMPQARNLCDDSIVSLVNMSAINDRPVAERQITHSAYGHILTNVGVWSSDGRWIAHIMDDCVCITDTTSGTTCRLTTATDAEHAPRPEACVFSPDGTQIAYVRPVTSEGRTWNQIFVCKPK